MRQEVALEAATRNRMGSVGRAVADIDRLKIWVAREIGREGVKPPP